MLDKYSKSLPITVTIITSNEEARIQGAILSVVGWVDEILVIDSGSNDRTCEIAEKLGAKVMMNPWTGYGPQKRFAEDHATNQWILNIDADERISSALQDEIVSLWEPIPAADGYALNIHDRIYGTHFFEKTPSYAPVRLYNKEKGRYSNHSIHDRVSMAVGTTVTHLHHRIYHESIKSLTHRIDKLNAYSTMQADDLHQRGRHITKWRLITEFSLSFWQSYLLKGRWKLGTIGFIHAMNYAFSRYLRLAKLYEKTHMHQNT
ncbi:MAG: glycosyltransferase family 2 protein [Alphaproteobacteria bacterium]|nr:MAG: glycosyltransferase family 2 protein [Alphaproteobacteria bacterium]